MDEIDILVDNSLGRTPSEYARQFFELIDPLDKYSSFDAEWSWFSKPEICETCWFEEENDFAVKRYHRHVPHRFKPMSRTDYI